MGRTAVIVADPDDVKHLDLGGDISIPGFDTVVLLTVPFAQLKTRVSELAAEIYRLRADLVLYSRNDQVFSRYTAGELIRAVPSGYSTFSGIDDSEAFDQARSVLADLKRGYGDVKFPPHTAVQSRANDGDWRGTFSIMFDTEQLAGARFGVPRIVRLLDRFRAPATFFVTGLMHHIYPNLLPGLHERGHEIGLHGPYHERLAGLPPEVQQRTLNEHLTDFQQVAPVVGANFIYRSDAHTITALAHAGLRYTTIYARNYFRPLAYRRFSHQPLPMQIDGHTLWLVPVALETYVSPWMGIKCLIDSVLLKHSDTSFPHVTILMHPFRDGALRHIGQLEALLHYLIEHYRLKPIALRDLMVFHTVTHPDAQIYASISRIDQSHPEAPKKWWYRSELYYQRIATIASLLQTQGRTPVLTLDAVDETLETIAVFPEIPERLHTPVALDPLIAWRGSKSGQRKLTTILRNPCAARAFVPNGNVNSLRLMARLSLPHSWQDIIGLVPEIGVRVAYRLHPGRILF